jgi:hypothetical protein
MDVNEHESYQNRPVPVYGFDRPWVIGGLNRTSLNSDYTYRPGASIDELRFLSNNSEFYYLQE